MCDKKIGGAGGRVIIPRNLAGRASHVKGAFK
jgi:hypothetical protein